MNFLKMLNKNKVKQFAIKSLKKWLCGKLPMPELKIIHEQPITIELKQTIEINEWTAGNAERFLIRDMMQELKKYTVFIDVELPDGTKCKQATLKVVKPK